MYLNESQKRKDIVKKLSETVTYFVDISEDWNEGIGLLYIEKNLLKMDLKMVMLYTGGLVKSTLILPIING